MPRVNSLAPCSVESAISSSASTAGIGTAGALLFTTGAATGACVAYGANISPEGDSVRRRRFAADARAGPTEGIHISAPEQVLARLVWTIPR